MEKTFLVLEDGEIFEGKSFGKKGVVFGEAVFNTSMTGYQEILTDPSYAGQLVCLTYPLIGNYGVNCEDTESLKPFARALIVRKLCRTPSNWRSRGNLDDYLKEQGIVGLEGIDTRKLTRHLRERGAMRAVISPDPGDPKTLLEKVLNSPKLEEEDLVSVVSTREEYLWDPEGEKSYLWPETSFNSESVSPFRVAVIDFGVKTNILRLLRCFFREVRVFPFDTGYETLMSRDPDGIFLSNGPGDPKRVTSGISLVQKVLGKKPVFGICLGHQLLSLSLGGETFKLKFGHRGANQPVKALRSPRIEITSQNHGFAVSPESLKTLPHEVTVSHINLNDFTNEGIRVDALKAFSVQYHPESSPGPHDSRYLFRDFVNLISGKSF